VTSRPSCSECIAQVVEQRSGHYQILGFSPQNSMLYIKLYFSDDLKSAELLIGMLKGREHLHRHFYIPITMAIICYVYSHSDDGQIPETLSKLYESFVLLYICSNIPDTCRQDIKKLSTLSNVPKILKPLFGKLCKTAYDMLRDKKLVFDEDILGITESDLKNVNLFPEQFDGLGLLHVEHFPTKQATTKRCYSFIHRAVQELLAAIFILQDTGNISGIVDEHFYEGSYLMNVFPFLFGLVSKEVLRPLVGKLIEIFNRNYKLLLSILFCLFEAHDETLCCEFGQAFSEKRYIHLNLRTLLDCHYACYFIAVCGAKKLNVTMHCNVSILPDHYCEIMYKYLQNTSTNIASFHFYCIHHLSHKGMEQFAKALSTQHNILSVKLPEASCDPGCMTALCNSTCKHNSQITNFALPRGELNENDLESIGSLLTTCLSLESLQLYCSPSEGVCLELSSSFCKGLCETKSLQKLMLIRWNLSKANSKVFGKIISQNHSFKVLYMEGIATTDCLDLIVNGLSCNTTTTTVVASPIETGASSTLGQCLEKCLICNHSLSIISFTSPYDTYISWSSTQVISICTGLCANTTVVTLDISGCYIDNDTCCAVCGMLSQNKTLQHLFLNPVHLEKKEAIALIDNCRANSTLKLLSLVQWPPKVWSGDEEGKNPFVFSAAQEINDVLVKIQKLRQEKNEPLLNIYWLVAIYIVLMCCYLILYV